MYDLIQPVLKNPGASAALLGAALGVIGSLLVALVTSALNRDKFMRESIWDKRQVACNEIVAQLNHSSIYAECIRENFRQDPQGYFGSEHLSNIQHEYGEKISAAQDCFHSNYLILPPGFRRRYERLMRERDDIWMYTTGPDIYLEPIALNEQAKRDLYDLATIELRIIPLWSRIWVSTKLWSTRFAEILKRLFRNIKRNLRLKKRAKKLLQNIKRNLRFKKSAPF